MGILKFLSNVPSEKNIEKAELEVMNHLSNIILENKNYIKKIEEDLEDGKMIGSKKMKHRDQALYSKEDLIEKIKKGKESANILQKQIDTFSRLVEKYRHDLKQRYKNIQDWNNYFELKWQNNIIHGDWFKISNTDKTTEANIAINKNRSQIEEIERRFNKLLKD